MTKIELAARTAHEVNRAYCNALGDASQKAWDESDKWQRDSALAGMQAVLENPNTTPEQSHEGWLKLKEEEGWTYGERKDPERKTHPCFRPYRELPREQRIKDYLFLAVARTILFQPEEEKEDEQVE